MTTATRTSPTFATTRRTAPAVSTPPATADGSPETKEQAMHPVRTYKKALHGKRNALVVVGMAVASVALLGGTALPAGVAARSGTPSDGLAARSRSSSRPADRGRSRDHARRLPHRSAGRGVHGSSDFSLRKVRAARPTGQIESLHSVSPKRVTARAWTPRSNRRASQGDGCLKAFFTSLWALEPPGKPLPAGLSFGRTTVRRPPCLPVPLAALEAGHPRLLIPARTDLCSSMHFY